MIKLLIYDLDGTLIDSGKDISNCVNRTLGDLGFSRISEAQAMLFVGKGVRNLMQRALQEASGMEPEEKLLERAIKLYRGYYRNHLLDETKLFPSVKEVLEHFKTRNQAVITNKPENFSLQILSALGVESYFSRIIGEEGFDTAGRKFGGAFPKKPSPESVLDVMKSADALPGETVLIGDSDIDVQTGKNAGIKTIAVTYGFSTPQAVECLGADLIINHPKQLIGCPLIE